jgi:hypothetical protein
MSHISAVFLWDYVPIKNEVAMRLNPTELAKLYGKWPSYIYLCLATLGPLLLGLALLVR